MSPHASAPSATTLAGSFRASAAGATRVAPAAFCSPAWAALRASCGLRATRRSLGASPALQLCASRPMTARAMAGSSGGPGSSESAALPETTTEFMVEMTCQGCVKNVRRNIESVEGVSALDISLDDKVVRITGTSPLQALEEGLKKTGLRSRLIGQGDPEKLDLTAAVAEFKGPTIHGVVRFTQVSMEVARVEAQFDGLSPSSRHGWSVNEFGDLTRGPASTGGHFNPTGQLHGSPDSEERHAGDLGNLQADDKGHATYVAANDKLKVWDLIGRAVVLYQNEDDLKNEGSAGPGIAAAVIARSAGVGQNYKSLCLCDGTVIWEATDSDYVAQKSPEIAPATASASSL